MQLYHNEEIISRSDVVKKYIFLKNIKIYLLYLVNNSINF